MSKTARLGLIAMVATLAVAQSAQALAHDEPAAKRPCSAAMLHGLYLFKGTGYAIINGEVKPKAVMGAVRFDGQGTTVTEALTVTVLGAPAFQPNGNAGTYTVSPDCTGTISFPNGPSWNIFVVSSRFFSQIQVGGPDKGMLQGDNWLISQ